MINGIVQFFNEIHGDGYIMPKNGSERVRFSYRSIKKEGFQIVHEGQLIKYEIQNTSRGPIAVNIIPIDGE